MRASDRAYQMLREDIIEWRLPPGTLLAEVEQAERLGVSRTPLREALSRLNADGLTTASKGRGIVVAAISLDDVTELFELRNALECQAAALAARRGDRELFGALAREFRSAAALLQADDPTRHDYYSLVERLDAALDTAMANPYLLQALRSLRLHLVRVRRLAKDNPQRLLASAGEHATIAEAVAAGDPALASAATAIHLHKSLGHLLATRNKLPEGSGFSHSFSPDTVQPASSERTAS